MRTRRAAALVIGLVCATETGWGQSPSTAPPSAPTGPVAIAGARVPAVVAGERGRALDEIVRRESHGAFWGAVIVVDGGEVLLEKGYGDAGGHRGVIGPDSWFDLGSVSKQITAAAVLRLAEMGKLRLNQPIGELLANVPKDKQAITVEQLLHHTSGLPVDPDADAASGGDRHKMVARVMKAKMASAPGERFVYNNVGYFVLAAIVEETAGMSFEDVLAEDVFVPAGMTATHTVSESASTDPRETRRQSGMMRGPVTTASQYAWTWWFKGATGVVSSLEDLRKWDASLRGDRVLNKGSRAAMFAPGKGGYGCGWFVDYQGTSDARAHHGGSTPGYRSFIIRLLNKPTMVAVLTDERSDVETIGRALMNAVAPAPTEAGVWTRAYLTRFEPDETGRYRSTPPDDNGEGGASWMVMPRYLGMDEQGRTIRDERTALVAKDPKAPGQWIMLSRIDDDAARLLVRELEAAIAARKSGGRRGEQSGLEICFDSSPYGMKPHEFVDYPTTARWRALADDAAASRFGDRAARDSDRRVTVFLEDAEGNRTPVVARMDVGTAEDLLGHLREVVGSPAVTEGSKEP